MEKDMRRLSLIVPVLAYGTLLSACQSSDFDALAVGIAQGLGGSVQSYPSTVYTPVPTPRSAVPYSPPVYTESDGSYVDRMVHQSQQGLLNTAPCDPAARAQWRRWVQSQARGNDMGDLYQTPPHCN